MTQPAQPTQVWLAPTTFHRLTAELEDLKGPQRQEIIERISAARDEGDLKENGGYHAAKDEQGKTEARILQLEEMLRTATTETSDDDGVETFLLGAREIDDDHEDIEVFSPQSPLGNALLGATKGATVDFEAPNGNTLKIEILDAVPFTE